MIMSNIFYIISLWCATNGAVLTDTRQYALLAGDNGYSFVKWNVPSVNPPSIAWMQAHQTQADAEAAIAASNAAYQASLPVPMPTGIEAPVVVLTDSDGKGWGVVADAGELVTYADHASPRPDAAIIAARQAAARADNQAHRERIAAIKADLDQVEAALDQADVTTTGPLGVAVAATTGVNKTALTEVRKVLVDIKAAAKNLRQASEKIRREIR
jgi:hypothetical protein